MPNRIDILKAEIESIKRQQKEDKRLARITSRWVKIDKRMPDIDTLRVLAWSNGQMSRCWHAEGKFYSFDGTWFYTENERLDGVTHWMPKDWMTAAEYPQYGPGVVNRAKYHWRKFTQGAQDMAHDLRPKGWSRNAQLSQKVIYYENQTTGEIRMGAPEQFPVSKGFSKVICNNTSEAEKWSEKLRQYNYARESKIDEKREAIEGEAAKEIRSEIHNRIANSKSKYGRVFLENYLQRMDRAEGRRRMTREEFNHAEAYEKNH